MSGLFGETLQLHQENGPDVELVVSGDEFYAEYETKDGYAAVYDYDAGLFCYARVEHGRFVSTGIPVTNPPPKGLPKNLRESAAVRNEKRAARQAMATPPDDAGSGPDSGRS